MSDFPLCQLYDKPEPEDKFPTCPLYGTKIVTEFPPGCATGVPGAEAHALIFQMKSKSFWPGVGDPAPYNAMARAYDVCMACQSTLRTNLHVRYLREKLQNA